MMPTEEIKNVIKQALADTDWTQLPDVRLSNKDQFVNYRSMLRLFLNVAPPAGYIPVPPEPIWIEGQAQAVAAEDQPITEGTQTL
jgi:hypothetical protein